MILDKEEIDQRLSSPFNLLNRLKALTASSSEHPSIPSSVKEENSQSRFEHPSIPPSIDELVDNVGEKLATAKCRSGAKEVLASAIDGLRVRVTELDDPMKLSRIATDMSKVVNGFDENKSSDTTTIPIIYRPIMLTENNFQIIQVDE